MKAKTLPVYNIEKFKPLCHEKDFYASTVSNHLKNNDFTSSPHKHNFFLVVLFTQGSGNHSVDFVNYDIKPGSIFMLSPGQIHSWTLTEDTDGYIFFHNKDFYELNFSSNKLQDYPFYCSVYNSPTLILKANDLQKSKSIFKEINLEYKQKQLIKFKRLFVLVELLYIDLLRLYLPQEQIDKQNQDYLIKLRKLEGLINDNYKTIKSPAKYAEMMFLGIKQLNRVCKECLNKSTSDIITDRIILEAKRLLIYSPFKIPEIAEQLGYTDISYFTRLFKKKNGITPAAFIKTYSALL
ncbi:MAG: helix-turn-helix domain-containing protein [Flavobacterium sp.]|nr:helix-turn-helix domain-containing protein [Flavobacterium sp.]